MKVRVVRDVAADEKHNFLGRGVKAGEEFYEYRGATYGCVDSWGGVALSEQDGETPFFEFPTDAISWVVSE